MQNSELQTGGLRFINENARLYHALQLTKAPPEIYEVAFEPLFGPAYAYLTPQAVEALETHLVKALNLGMYKECLYQKWVFSGTKCSNLDINEVFVQADIEALIRLVAPNAIY